MKIVIYSVKKAEMEGIGWHRDGDNIAYFCNGIRKSSQSQRCLFTLRFAYTFSYSGDTVYFAYSYPYTVSQLKEYLDTLEADQTINEFVSRRILCRTLAGNRCEYLTITSVRLCKKIAKPQSKKKKGVCFTARVHPGETVSSWMMQGECLRI